MTCTKGLTIGIAGGSGSGKTHLSLLLKDGLKDKNVLILHTDRYYKAQRPVMKAPFSNKTYEDFNHPDGVDIQRLCAEYQAAREGNEFDLIIIEGFLLLHFDELREWLDLKVYVDCRADERMIRRTGWFLSKGYSYEETVQEYLDLVRFRHDEYVEPTKWHADIIINGSTGPHKGAELILVWIEHRLLPGNE